MGLGIYVKKLREQRGLLQGELAKLSGLSRSYISRIEIDDYGEISAQKLLALAKALNVKPDSFSE